MCGFVTLWHMFLNTLQSDCRSEPNTVQRKITHPNNVHLEGWWAGGTADLILAIHGCLHWDRRSHFRINDKFTYKDECTVEYVTKLSPYSHQNLLLKAVVFNRVALNLCNHKFLAEISITSSWSCGKIVASQCSWKIGSASKKKSKVKLFYSAPESWPENWPT